jgi:drug/metabolite transporter (DMT)-like permease
MENQMPFSLLLMLLLITIIWGYAWIFMKVSLYYMGPFTGTAHKAPGFSPYLYP